MTKILHVCVLMLLLIRIKTTQKKGTVGKNSQSYKNSTSINQNQNQKTQSQGNLNNKLEDIVEKDKELTSKMKAKLQNRIKDPQNWKVLI